jgi:hypothetical protein
LAVQARWPISNLGATAYHLTIGDLKTWQFRYHGQISTQKQHFIVQKWEIPNFLAVKAWWPNFNLGVIIYHPRIGHFKSLRCIGFMVKFQLGGNCSSSENWGFYIFWHYRVGSISIEETQTLSQ